MNQPKSWQPGLSNVGNSVKVSTSCIFTARKRSLPKLCFHSFYTCLSFCPRGGGGYPSMPCMWYPSMPCRSPGVVSRPTARGEVDGSGRGGVSRPTAMGEVEGSGGGVSRPTPGRCIPACTEADPTSALLLLLRAVRILLECILVGILIFS